MVGAANQLQCAKAQLLGPFLYAGSNTRVARGRGVLAQHVRIHLRPEPRMRHRPLLYWLLTWQHWGAASSAVAHSPGSQASLQARDRKPRATNLPSLPRVPKAPKWMPQGVCELRHTHSCRQQQVPRPGMHPDSEAQSFNSSLLHPFQ